MPLIETYLDGVVFVQGKNKGSFPYCNTYIVKDGDDLVVIDPTCGPENLKSGLAFLDGTFSDITAVFNTHFHVDHSAACRWLASSFNVPVYMHERDASAVTSWDAMAARYRIESPDLKKMLFRVFNGVAGFRPFSVTHPFAAADPLPAGIGSLHCPGHTPGHCAFFYRGLLFSGDVELNVPWVGNANSSVRDFLHTTEILSDMSFAGILPGHGMPVFDGLRELLLRYRSELLNAAERVHGALSAAPEPLNRVAALSRRFLSPTVRGRFNSENGPLLHHFESLAVWQYLIYLESKGRARRTVSPGGRVLWSKEPGNEMPK